MPETADEKLYRARKLANGSGQMSPCESREARRLLAWLLDIRHREAKLSAWRYCQVRRLVEMVEAE